MCHCGAAFTRRDLLTRHWRIANHDGREANGATSPSETATDERRQGVVHVPEIASSDLNLNGVLAGDGRYMVPQDHVTEIEVVPPSNLFPSERHDQGEPVQQGEPPYIGSMFTDMLTDY